MQFFFALPLSEENILAITGDWRKPCNWHVACIEQMRNITLSGRHHLKELGQDGNHSLGSSRLIIP
jgi:hypothetical protein